MNLPTNGTAEQIWANGLTNKALGQNIASLRHNRRVFDKKTADALLEEAAKRLSWQDNYAKHQGES
jgi:hypothetical protein